MAVEVKPELVSFSDGEHKVYLSVWDDHLNLSDNDDGGEGGINSSLDILEEIVDYMRRLKPTPSILAPLAEEVE